MTAYYAGLPTDYSSLRDVEPPPHECLNEEVKYKMEEAGNSKLDLSVVGG